MRHEPNQHPNQHQEDGRRDRVAARERAARDQGDTQQYDHLESKHELILTSRVPIDHIGPLSNVLDEPTLGACLSAFVGRIRQG